MTTMTLSRLPTLPAQTSKAEPLFKSARAALVFALHYSMQQYVRPLLNRIAAGPSNGETIGLSGFDGVAQAGMIRAELARLTPLHRAVLIAAIAPQRNQCECRAACCGGWVLNPEWANALGDLTTASAAAALSG
jgi:hypothetical protein